MLFIFANIHNIGNAFYSNYHEINIIYLIQNSIHLYEILIL